MLFSFATLAGGIVLHELGHFFFARLYGRRAEFGIEVRDFLPSFVTISQPTFEIKNGQDLKRALKEEAVIARGGLIGAAVPVVILLLHGGMWVTCLLLMVVFMLYTLWEVGSVYINIHLENIGELVYLKKD